MQFTVYCTQKSNETPLNYSIFSKQDRVNLNKAHHLVIRDSDSEHDPLISVSTGQV